MTMSWLPEDIREASGGESIDRLARDAIRLAHQALERFPDLVKRHKYVAGGAAISTSLVVIAGVAIAHRMRKGQTAQEALDSLTEEELTHPIRDEHPVGDEVDDSVEPPDAPEPEVVQPLARIAANGASGPTERREGSEAH
jgi:hypothetical protein